MNKENTLKPFPLFCCTIGYIPTSYKVCMTYEEQLLWFCSFLEDTVIPQINNNFKALEEMQEVLKEMKDYMDHYFDNLNVQEEINNKLDEMVLSGELTEIIQNALFNIPININFISRIFRTYNESEFYNVVGMTSYSNNVVILTTNALATSFKVLTYNRVNDSLSSFSLNLSGLTDIAYYNNKLYYATNSTTVYETGIDGSNVDSNTITKNIKKFEFKNSYCYAVDSSYNFVVLNDDFTVENDNTGITITNCSGIAVTSSFYCFKVGNTLHYYKLNTSDAFVFNNQNFIPTKANTCFVVGECLGITSFGDSILFGTTKKVIPIRDSYVVSVFEGNASNSVSLRPLADLTYNSSKYEAEIHVASNTSYNPSGLQSNPFPNLYEALEVFENGEYTKGNIWCDEEMSFSNLLITDINKKLGLYFEGSTINGIEFRNSTYIEVNNATISGHFEDTSSALYAVGLNLIIVNCSIDTDATYDVVASYGARVTILTSTTINNTIASQSGGVIINRNTSAYDSKRLLDSSGKFEPDSVLIYYDENATPQEGDEITINHNINMFSALRFEIIVYTHSFWVEVPITGSVKNLPVVDFTNQTFSLYNYRIEIDNTNHKISIVSCRTLDLSTNETTTPETSVTYLKAVWGLT